MTINNSMENKFWTADFKMIFTVLNINYPLVQ
jgi:hypothetical protein